MSRLTVQCRDGKERYFESNDSDEMPHLKTKFGTVYVIDSEANFRGFIVLRYVPKDGVHVIAASSMQPVEIRSSRGWKWSAN